MSELAISDHHDETTKRRKSFNQESALTLKNNKLSNNQAIGVNPGNTAKKDSIGYYPTAVPSLSVAA